MYYRQVFGNTVLGVELSFPEFETRSHDKQNGIELLTGLWYFGERLGSLEFRAEEEIDLIREKVLTGCVGV